MYGYTLNYLLPDINNKKADATLILKMKTEYLPGTLVST